MTTRLPVSKDPYIAEFALSSTPVEPMVPASTTTQMGGGTIAHGVPPPPPPPSDPSSVASSTRRRMTGSSPGFSTAGMMDLEPSPPAVVTRHRLSEFSKAFLDEEERTEAVASTSSDFVDVHHSVSSGKFVSDHKSHFSGRKSWGRYLCDAVWIVFFLLAIFVMTLAAIVLSTRIMANDRVAALLSTTAASPSVTATSASSVSVLLFIPDGDMIPRQRQLRAPDEVMADRRHLQNTQPLLHIGIIPQNQVLEAYNSVIQSQRPVLIQSTIGSTTYTRTVDSSQVDREDTPKEVIFGNLHVLALQNFTFKVACAHNVPHCDVYQEN